MSSSFYIRPVTRFMLLFGLAVFVAGCGGRVNIFKPREAQEPAPPPLVQPLFADFDQRAQAEQEPQIEQVPYAVSAPQVEPNLHLPDRISIPAIELDTPVVELGWSATTDPAGRVFSQWDVAEYAAGWHKNSAALGLGGNVVMSGHNNILGAVFRELDQLREGDIATITSGDIEYDYKVTAVMIVPDKTATPEQRKENAKWIGAFDDDRLTLVSCWPRDDNTHRIVVVAHRLSEGDTATAKRSE